MPRTIALIAVAGALAAFPAIGQNLVANADFETDLAGWTLLWGGTPGWQAADEGGCPASGSAAVPSSDNGGFQVAGVAQCFPVAGLTEVAASASFRGGGSLNRVGVAFHLSSNCVDLNPATAGSPAHSPSPGAWARLEMPLSAVPPDTLSIQLIVGGSIGAPFVFEVDHVYLGAAERIFAADAEGDEEGSTQPCRWSAVVP